MKSLIVTGAILSLVLVADMAAPQTVREACAADAARVCPDTTDPQSRRECMIAHRSELSEGCLKAYRATHGGDPASIATSETAAPEGAVTADGGLDTVAERMAGRSFPSVFAPWNLAQNFNKHPNMPAVPLNETMWDTIARHDLYWRVFNSMGLKLKPRLQYVVLTPEFTPESIQAALNNRAKLLAANPHMLILSAVNYFSATRDYLPPDSPWWLHDAKNARFERNNMEYKSSRLDFSKPEFQDRVAALCGALLKTGVYDGFMLDWWHDDDEMGAHRLALIKKIRAVVGEKAILIGNVNGRLPTRTASYLNGMYMEGLGSKFFSGWRTAAANLIWGERNLRKPAITALEGWWETTGRDDYPLMRATTTLSVVFSNGYVLFSDPNELPTPDHLHDWYPFWDKSLGKAVGPLADLRRPDLSGAYTRQYENGEVVFNPPGNHSVSISFKETRRSSATNVTGRSFTVPPGDGDLFLDTR